ncbi:CMP-N-acetylneuraminic acid synthetase [Pseudobutyrivibrio sp. ACV-2]|uniref:acylneuraminate cytidylyltransferase family protein n=1 Tax=Pseudobutyrivibrio sp. ACV-2 TaxID=1520801 RepID=UPI00089C9849|nr:CMP-N-acetylneuraminic acid synthetase [Pseudobutyrivibrio sp. ACV-2]SEA52358.1 CMP-N-acetylneuraminic acid synthetase [Pseudobutyrivibrio sp. ACV-2]
MKTVAFVPIKLNNERLPGKNLKKFSDGTPLVQVILDKLVALKGECIDEVYCYCSQEEITGYLPEGVQWLQRPTFLDDKYCKGRAIYEEFVKTIEADVYVLCHATTPFTSTEHIKECIQAVQSGNYKSAFAGQKIQTFIWKDGKPFNFDLSNPPRTQDMEAYYLEIPTPYVFTKESFAETHARSNINPYIAECDAVECVDVDNADDFELADAVYGFIKNKYGMN